MALSDSDAAVVYSIRSIALVAALVASVFSIMLIAKHLRNFRRPTHQSKIVGILWMVPIYSVNCVLSLWFPQAALFIDLARDCYEAYVLYLFFALLLYYVSNGDEYSLVSIIESENSRNDSGSGTVKLSSLIAVPGLSAADGEKFLRRCKFGVLQYCIVRPISTIIAIILDVCGQYREQDFSVHYGYFWITLILNLSISYALVTLVMFYNTLKTKLAPFDPLPKFLCVKAIVFFAFWQGVLITILVQFEAIEGIGPYDTNLSAKVLQDFLICIELPFIAYAHNYAFSATPYIFGLDNDVESGFVSVLPSNRGQSYFGSSSSSGSYAQVATDAEYGFKEPLMSGGGGVGVGPTGGHHAVMMRATGASAAGNDANRSSSFDDPCATQRTTNREYKQTLGHKVNEFFRRNFAYNEALHDLSTSIK